MTEQEWLDNNQLSLDIWNKKYRYNNESFDEWLDRVSGKNEDIKSLIKTKRFLFGGRILAGRGIKKDKKTLSNCYVIPSPDDNLNSIFETGKMLAVTYSTGGGCGTDVSKLRPKGSITHNAAKASTGPTSFMEFYSYITGLISQEGRRGALMLTMSVNHPDIKEFINLKSRQGVCEKANISVKVTDEFMQAVIDDKDWITEFTSKETGTITRTFKARDLMYLIAKRNWEWAEPGVLYWDKITQYNMQSNNPEFVLEGTNPCGELPLQAGGACLLGSMNLSQYVHNPFSSLASIDYLMLYKDVRTAVAGLNEVLLENMDTHPLQIQRDIVKNWRAIGLGTMGLADMFIQLGVKYGSDRSLNYAIDVYDTIALAAIHESMEWAKKHGCFPKCKKEELMDSSFIKSLELPQKFCDQIKTYGLYNSQLLTCAPTGSIATMLQVSTGIEPNFAFKYTRKTQSLNGKDTYYEVNASIVDDYFYMTSPDNMVNKAAENKELPEYFVESKDIKPIDRIKMQSIIQRFIDNSISSTVNLPKEATIEDVYNIYIEAWKYGLKGVTIYRQGCNREGILTVKKPVDIPVTGAPKRPEVLPCDIHQVKVKGENFIVCVGLYENTYKPYEMFVFRLKNKISLSSTKGQITKVGKGHYKLSSANIEVDNLLNTDISVEEKAATLYSSMLLRHGINIKYIIKTAKKVNDNITSFSSAMCRVLAKYIPTEIEGKCPECGADLVHSGGCSLCPSCGYSKCD